MVDKPIEPSLSKPFRCPKCNKGKFKSLAAVRDHCISLLHTAHCEQCDRDFQDLYGFLQHSQGHEKQNTTAQKQKLEVAAQQTKKSKLTASAIVPTPTQNKSAPTIADKNEIKKLGGSIFDVGSLGEEKTLPFQEYLVRKIIFEDLRARCHPPARLEREGYFHGVSSMTKSRRKWTLPIKENEFLQSPKVALPTTKRLAIVIDCEMVEIANGQQTLAFLSAIDFFTGKILINNPVKPKEKVHNWRTKISGVSAAIMDRACAKGEAILGWQAARQRLCDFMDEGTVLIGHSLHHDLKVLGLVHANIVDSAILTSEAVFPHIDCNQRLKRKWGLKILANEFLNRNIQGEKSGHSALEDTYATRDVVFWCMCNTHLLQTWAEKTKNQEQERMSAKKKRKNERKNLLTQNVNDYGSHESEEILRWSDIAEDCGWPHPDTGYDPWSD